MEKHTRQILLQLIVLSIRMEQSGMINEVEILDQAVNEIKLLSDRALSCQSPAGGSTSSYGGKCVLAD